jgi:site-specific DNA-methyltransferase (adenine-specific)
MELYDMTTTKTLSDFVEGGKEKPSRVIFVGNPPYQEEQGRSSAKAIYHKFIEQALSHGDEALFVIPARWYATGKGLDEFRNSTLTSGKAKKIVDFPLSATVFPTVDIASGICFLHMANNHNGNCAFIDGNGTEHDVDLSRYDILLREPKSITIVDKIRNKATNFMDVSSQTPFGLITTFDHFSSPSSTTLKCETTNGTKNVKSHFVTRGREMIPQWKVITSKAGPASGRPDRFGRRTVLSIVKVLPPQSVCLQTYIVVGTYPNEEEASNCVSYLALKLPRFMLAQRAISQDLPPSAWLWVPKIDFTKTWTDAQLYEYFGLTAAEQAHIEATIR